MSEGRIYARLAVGMAVLCLAPLTATQVVYLPDRDRGVCVPKNDCERRCGPPPEECYTLYDTEYVCCERDQVVRYGEDIFPGRFSRPNFLFWSELPQTCRLRRERRISEIMCEKYHNELATKSYKKVLLVIGGKETEEHEFPHMALLGYDASGKIEWRCGGSLISDRFVLTAAHCVQRSKPKVVRLGEHNVDENDLTHKDYRIAEIVVHPEYRPPRKYNDIALLKLKWSVTFDRGGIIPACLDVSGSRPNTRLTVTGWGVTENEAPSNVLRKADLRVVEEEDCRRVFDRNEKLPWGIIESQMCANDPGRRRDTCYGDSGGPLQKKTSCGYELVGITSFGENRCAIAAATGVYTRVSSYLSWIENIVWPNGV